MTVKDSDQFIKHIKTVWNLDGSGWARQHSYTMSQTLSIAGQDGGYTASMVDMRWGW